MTIPGIICHLQESHSEILGRSQGFGSRDQSLGPRPDRVPNCRQLPKAFSASSHAAIFAPGTAAGSLRAPEGDAPNRASSFFLPPGIQTPCPGRSWAPGPRMGCCLQSQLPQVSSQRDRETVPSLLRLASGRAPRPRKGEAGGACRGRRGGGRERGGWGDPEGEEQERAAWALPFSTQRCHMRRALRFLGLWRESLARSRAGGRRPGDHTGEPPPAPSPGPRWELPGLVLPHPQIHTVVSPNPTLSTAEPGGLLPVASLFAPTPGCEKLLHFPKPLPPRCTPTRSTEHPHPFTGHPA